MNAQVDATPNGDPVWVSGALPGAVHDTRAARVWRIGQRIAAAGLLGLGGKGYAGYSRTPFKGRNKPEWGQPHPRAPAQPGRTRDGPAQELADPAPPAVLPAPRHRDRPGGAGPSTTRNTMKSAHWALNSRGEDGSLPTGREIAARFDHKERWGRLIKQWGLQGRFDRRTSISSTSFSSHAAASSFRCGGWIHRLLCSVPAPPGRR
ncbi:hypothetical protein GCM10023224_08670 [Streptomonospora halophila]|uniref:Transposase n=1 Tax=Streptomonospora halophila TaxID=427369 RepID=A0ABP9GDZ1_9ACTN